MKSMGRLIIISLAGVVFAINICKAQFEPIDGYYAESLLFSQTQWNGSARIQGIGGAQTALGGDISSISGNPAGLGFYNHSEFSFSPSLNFMTTQSNYLGSPNTSTIGNFNIGNLGLVLNKNRSTSRGNGFLGGSFGFSYNRINDFHDKAYYAGANTTNDFIDYIINSVISNNGIGSNDYTSLAYQNYLINDYSSPNWNNASYVEVPSDSTPVLQSEKITSSGSQDQWSFSYGADFSDRFYFGLSLGVVSLDYKTSRQYEEVRYPQSILDNFILDESLRITGTGINGTFGAIVRPLNNLTLGVTYTTPTLYQINDEYNSGMSSTWRNSAFAYYSSDNNFTGNQSDVNDPIVSDYNLKTASHLNAGAAYFFNKNGFVAGDVEWTNYSSGRLSGGNIDFQSDNNLIDEMYKSALNYRVGGEYRVKDYRFRLGYNYAGDAYNNVDNINRSKNAFSGGLGYRSKTFYTDLTGIYSFYKSIAVPYDINPQPVANFDNSKLAFVLTTGFLF